VSALDPLRGAPIAAPAHFRNALALQPFDLETFLRAAATTLRWACPVSGTPGTVRHLARDAYFTAVLRAAAAAHSGQPAGGISSGSGGDEDAVEVAFDGRWRPAGQGGRSGQRAGWWLRVVGWAAWQ
jgi:hypothetical protein